MYRAESSSLMRGSQYRNRYPMQVAGQHVQQQNQKDWRSSTMTGIRKSMNLYADRRGEPSRQDIYGGVQPIRTSQSGRQPFNQTLGGAGSPRIQAFSRPQNRGARPTNSYSMQKNIPYGGGNQPIQMRSSQTVKAPVLRTSHRVPFVGRNKPQPINMESRSNPSSGQKLPRDSRRSQAGYKPSPATAKVKYEVTKSNESSSGPARGFGICTTKGLVRNYNEDRVSVIMNVSKEQSVHAVGMSCSYFSVFDGHGGHNCANYLRENLHKIILSDINFPNDCPEAIKCGIEKSEREFLSGAAKGGQITDKSGSCALVSIFKGILLFKIQAMIVTLAMLETVELFLVPRTAPKCQF